MQRDFKGIWIPKELWLSKDLNLTEKIMLIEIDSLDNENGCFATNDYFANFFVLSKGRISKIINNLVKRGYINSEIEYKKGTQIVEKRTLGISRWCKQKNNCPYRQKHPEGMFKCDAPSSQERLQPLDENDQYNKLKNKLNNNNSSSQVRDRTGQDAFEFDGESESVHAKESCDAGAKKKKIFAANSDPYLLAKFLEQNIAANNLKFPQSETQRQRWARDFDLMLRRDKIEADDIAAVIEWC